MTQAVMLRRLVDEMVGWLRPKTRSERSTNAQLIRAMQEVQRDNIAATKDIPPPPKRFWRNRE